MGTDISQQEFTPADYARFRARLEQSLSVLAGLLQQPGFGTGPATVGAELELFLIDGPGRPLPRNQAIRAAVADPRVTVELNRFNLELNASPIPLAGRPFTALGAELDLLLDRVSSAARAFGGRLALAGILPTLRRDDLHPGIMTGVARYRALDHGLRRLRRDPFRIRIAGDDPLEVASEDVTPEGATTSFQVHLRTDPQDFTRVYNAVQLATAPVLAVSGNSPTFLGHRLWEETRIALIKQAVDDRVPASPRRTPSRATFGTGWLRGGPLEAFAESVRLYQPVLPVLHDEDPEAEAGGRFPPPLPELRLHQSTIWRWNRAIYDPAGSGHLRIEMRALSSGPTVTDMLASAAFLAGLSLWLAAHDPQWTHALPFERAEDGFYRAAQHGLDVELSWPAGRDRTRIVRAAELVPELLPCARKGLLDAGVAAEEADRLLEVIHGRVASGQTGAVWQRVALATAERHLDRHRALAAMLERYLEHAATGQPVHTWPLPH